MSLSTLPKDVIQYRLHPYLAGQDLGRLACASRGQRDQIYSNTTAVILAIQPERLRNIPSILGRMWYSPNSGRGIRIGEPPMPQDFWGVVNSRKVTYSYIVESFYKREAWAIYAAGTHQGYKMIPSHSFGHLYGRLCTYQFRPLSTSLRMRITTAIKAPFRLLANFHRHYLDNLNG
jgi:hypothetical protein